MTAAPIEIRVTAGIDDVRPDDWNRAAAGSLAFPDGRPGDPFLDHAFFAALEGSGSAAIETG